MRRTGLCLLWLACGCGALYAQLNGRVVDEQRKAMEGVWTVWTRLPDLTVAGDTVTSGAVATDAKGEFAFTGLKDGVYVLCAYPNPRTDYLGTCTWKPNPPQLTVKGTARVSSQELVVEKGVRIQIRVDDAEALWSGGSGSKAGYRLGLRSEEGGFVPAAPLQRDKNGYDYVMLAPKGKRQKLLIEAGSEEVEEPSAARKGAKLEEDLGEVATGTAGQRRFVVRKGK